MKKIEKFSVNISKSDVLTVEQCLCVQGGDDKRKARPGGGQMPRR